MEEERGESETGENSIWDTIPSRSHPFLAAVVLALFIKVFSRTFIYFSPLIVSTLLCILAFFPLLKQHSDPQTVQQLRLSSPETRWRLEGLGEVLVSIRDLCGSAIASVTGSELADDFRNKFEVFIKACSELVSRLVEMVGDIGLLMPDKRDVVSKLCKLTEMLGFKLENHIRTLSTFIDDLMSEDPVNYVSEQEDDEAPEVEAEDGYVSSSRPADDHLDNSERARRRGHFTSEELRGAPTGSGFARPRVSGGRSTGPAEDWSGALGDAPTHNLDHPREPRGARDALDRSRRQGVRVEDQSGLLRGAPTDSDLLRGDSDHSRRQDAEDRSGLLRGPPSDSHADRPRVPRAARGGSDHSRRQGGHAEDRSGLLRGAPTDSDLDHPRGPRVARGGSDHSRRQEAHAEDRSRLPRGAATDSDHPRVPRVARSDSDHPKGHVEDRSGDAPRGSDSDRRRVPGVTSGHSRRHSIDQSGRLQGVPSDSDSDRPRVPRVASDHSRGHAQDRSGVHRGAPTSSDLVLPRKREEREDARALPGGRSPAEDLSERLRGASTNTDSDRPKVLTGTSTDSDSYRPQVVRSDSSDSGRYSSAEDRPGVLRGARPKVLGHGGGNSTAEDSSRVLRGRPRMSEDARSRFEPAEDWSRKPRVARDDSDPWRVHEDWSGVRRGAPADPPDDHRARLPRDARGRFEPAEDGPRVLRRAPTNSNLDQPRMDGGRTPSGADDWRREPEVPPEADMDSYIAEAPRDDSDADDAEVRGYWPTAFDSDRRIPFLGGSSLEQLHSIFGGGSLDQLPSMFNGRSLDQLSSMFSGRSLEQLQSIFSGRSLEQLQSMFGGRSLDQLASIFGGGSLDQIFSGRSVEQLQSMFRDIQLDFQLEDLLELALPAGLLFIRRRYSLSNLIFLPLLCLATGRCIRAFLRHRRQRNLQM